MAGHRFEIGEGVVHIEKRFPNGERRVPLMVVDRLAESQLGPAPAHEAAREAARLEAPAPAEPARDGSPWSA
jgi:hypothetical protein